MHPGDDALVELALGSETADLAEAAHVRDCATCLTRVAELAEVVTLVREGDQVGFVDPPPEAWARILARLDAEPTDFAGPAPTAADASHATPGPRRRPSRARSIGPWVAGLVAACAVGLLVGRVTAPDAPSGPAETVVARAGLEQIGTTNERGEADVVRAGTGIRLVVRTDRLEAGQDPLEVWLINRDGKRMVSLGLLTVGAGHAQAFAIDQRLIDDGYVVVDISREPLDGDPAHSGQSLVRGTLDT